MLPGPSLEGQAEIRPRRVLKERMVFHIERSPEKKKKKEA